MGRCDIPVLPAALSLCGLGQGLQGALLHRASYRKGKGGTLQAIWAEIQIG